VNKTHDELCQELATLRDQLEDANQVVAMARDQGKRLEAQLRDNQAMLGEALALGEEASNRYQELKASRPVEIQQAVMRARREWAAQADPEHLRERDARVAAEALEEAAKDTVPAMHQMTHWLKERAEGLRREAERGAGA